MAFRDYSVTRSPKQLPIDGQMFTFPDRISAQSGEVLLRVQAAAQDAGPDAAPGAVFEAAGISEARVMQAQADLLGDGHAALITAGLGSAIAHVVQALTAWHVYGQESAEQVWNGLGPTAAPNRAARRRPSATAKSTRSPASMTGTSSPVTGKAARRGGTSSRSGR